MFFCSFKESAESLGRGKTRVGWRGQGVTYADVKKDLSETRGSVTRRVQGIGMGWKSVWRIGNE